MAVYNIGRVAYVNKGAYNAATVYEKYDVVLYQNGSYAYINDTSAAGNAPTNATYWTVMLDPTDMNAATEDANDAAALANEKAGLANTATTNANNATIAANEAVEDIEDILPMWSDVDVDVTEVEPGNSTLASISQDVDGTHIDLTLPTDMTKWAAVDILASDLDEGESATAGVSQDGNGTHFTVGIPKGDTGDSGTYIGDEEPTNPLKTVWLDTDEPDLMANYQDMMDATAAANASGPVSASRTTGDGTPGTTDTYTIVYGNGNTTSYDVYNGADGVTTASQLPIVDAGEYFTTHNVEAALQEVGARFVASELPVATYTYNGNAEIVVSAVDVDTDTFTSIGHGLVDGNVIFPTLNLNAGAKFPLLVYAGGMAQRIYYVVGKTDDTFQISLTSGGAAINLTTNATIDLASWHFEKGVSEGIIISGLTAKKKYRAVAHGKYSSLGAKYFAPFKPTSWSDTPGFIGASLLGYSYPQATVAGHGGVQIIAKMEFDTTLGWISLEYQCVDVNTGNAAQLTPTYSMNIYSIPYTFKNTEITAIRFKQHNQAVANGTTLEVYDA